MLTPAPPGQHRPGSSRRTGTTPGRDPAPAAAGQPLPARPAHGRAVPQPAGRIHRRQIIAAYRYVTGPFRGKPRHTAAEQEWLRGYTEPITRHLAHGPAGQATLLPAPTPPEGDPA